MRSPITLGQRPGAVATVIGGSTPPPNLPPPPPTQQGAFDPGPFDVAKRWNTIPRRDWIMPPIFIAQHYSMLVATGASGKSAVSISLALALVTGRYDILQLPVDRPCKVILINGEDGAQELTRRVRATCQHFGISLSDVAGRFLIIGARDVPGLTFNRADRGGIVANETGMDLLEAMVRGFAADVVIIDRGIGKCGGGSAYGNLRAGKLRNASGSSCIKGRCPRR
jgi:RecA-family ATPase